MGALALDPTNANYWATLGVVGQERALQQHALIRALQINPKLSAAWVNLGQVSTSMNVRHTLEGTAPDVVPAARGATRRRGSRRKLHYQHLISQCEEILESIASWITVLVEVLKG